MIDKQLQTLLDAPLADPLKLNLPLGRRSVPHAHVVEADCEAFPEKLTKAEVKSRKVDQAADKLNAVLDYYATTDIPVDRIAAHTGLEVPQVINAMKRRGRALRA